MTDNNVCIDSNIIESISTDKIETKKKQEKKCAPGVIFDAGSCITLPVLISMAEAYNKVNTDKIKLSCRKETLHPRKYKKYLLKKIGERCKKCTTQLCWTQQDFIKKMNEEMKIQLEKFTLRPEGPNGRFEWLNTININEVMDQHEIVHKDFLFLGAVPMDFHEIKQEGVYDLDLDKTKKDGITKFGIVFNLDNHNQSGSHWVAAYADMESGQVYYFDSYGTRPEKRVTNFMSKLAKHYEETYPEKKCDVRHAKTRHQRENSECGVYSINFILELLGGKSFDEIEKNVIPDKEVNKLRTKIFRNVEF
jgi:hypothetical protein